jgi:hypothetical protein
MLVFPKLLSAQYMESIGFELAANTEFEMHYFQGHVLHGVTSEVAAENSTYYVSGS